MKLKIILLSLFLVSCATRTPVTDKLTRQTHLPEKTQLTDVPIIEQEEKQCGPASLAMVLQHHGLRISPESLSQDLFQKDLGGSFRSDILASARREGMMALEINELSNVFQELTEGNPVIVFQNLRFSFMPQWHFSVLTGYDLDGPDVILNSGDKKQTKMDMRLFERSWILGGKWAAVILPPDKLAKTSTELAHLESASLLEKIGKVSEAQQAYQTILKRWPGSFLALIGSANVAYSLNQKAEAEKFLLKAVKENPKSAISWHNLALIQSELKKEPKARISARKALAIVEKDNEPSFRVSLKKLLE